MKFKSFRWDASKPYYSFQAAQALTPFVFNIYLDGLERGEKPSGMLAIRGPYDVRLVRDGELLVVGESGSLEILDVAEF